MRRPSSHFRLLHVAAGALFLLIAFLPPVLAGYSVDESPTENPLDPGDIFLPGVPPPCEVDDGDGSCPVAPNLKVPNPQQFDLDAYTINDPLQVCPAVSPYPPGILFSFDDGDPGPAGTSPDHFTEIFFYDHCGFVSPTRRSYYTSVTETYLGLALDPPPTGADDDVDAYETRAADSYWQQGFDLLFSPDTPSDGGLGAGSEANVYASNVMAPAPAIWATPRDLGVPDPENCDVDGIARITDPDNDTWMLLFTTDALAPCGLDPGDIYVSDVSGNYWLYADDVTDMRIAISEADPVDIDALAVNTDGQIEILEPYEPPDPSVFKADWPNYAPSGMPDFSQDHQGWPGTWCGPTALSDSLWWFDSEMECDRDRTGGDAAESEPNDTCDVADRLGEDPWIPATLSPFDPADDWYEFEVPYRARRPLCSVVISTCARRNPGDADTLLELYGDCSSSGVPGNLIASNDDACAPDLQSEIRTTLEGGRYWVRVVPGSTGTGGNYNLSLGIDCYPMVEAYPGKQDDHSNDNPRPLVEDLSACMNTDDQNGTGSGHLGTKINDMDTCVGNWLADRNLDRFYDHSVTAAPAFDLVADEIERSQDVVLLLGFYWSFDGSTWTRCGGHFVTAAGVDRLNGTITLSDPALNNAEAPPAGNGAPGRVRGPNHADHAPAATPPPDHDDAQDVSHDRYAQGPSRVGPPVAQWAIPAYGTPGSDTTCDDVYRWCMGPESGQNPPESPQPQDPCPDPLLSVSAEVEGIVDVSPHQTPVCVRLDAGGTWPNNLRMSKGACPGPSLEPVPYDVIRGKLCSLRFGELVAKVDLGYVQCLADDAAVDQFDDVSPDHTDCFGGWFYLVRQTGDPDYGNAYPGGEARVPDSGDCP